MVLQQQNDMNNKLIKKISSHKIHSNTWLTVTRDQIETKNGHKTHFYIVERKHISIIIPHIDNKFVMVSQYRYPVNKNSLEFPQGFCESGETSEQCAKRELIEETGYESTSLIYLGKLWTSAGFTRQCIYVYEATDLIQKDQKLDNTEFDLQIFSFQFGEILQKITDGTIKNAPTLAALSLYMAHRAVEEKNR